ncbi:glycoside hydrolase family 16 protein [Rhodococcus sp. IEGM 1366]|uniref:glycoside hydrolase family 16 protein n=1 Tax=Rhodococcus sp. IEGM 1366 TaxID=3082223 RepID=UPI0029534A58|nr:glycoside hydrolase family 16 protein [Rhodococcus sp. IEGM 1366]MDV8068831.1 glycoside hydrolase family 16 protein [Rhodococcus sp. IEGM 1366]
MSRNSAVAVRSGVVLSLTSLLLVTSCVNDVTRSPEMRMMLGALGSDEFDGAAGQPPNPALWGFDVGGGGWGNQEKQVYTDSVDNASLDGNGNLVLQARRTDKGFTSARIVTRDKFTFTEGTLAARIKFPMSPGIHPAFWLLGEDLETVGYPESGEIDIMELVHDGAEFHNAVHGPWVDPAAHSEGKWKMSSDGPLGSDASEDFHIYEVMRTVDSISIVIDGVVVGDYLRSEAPEGAKWVFDKPFYVLMNIAVGGEWPGPTDITTSDVSTMTVDWIRYFR